MKLYPAIDIMGGKAVRLTKGDASKSIVYGDPAEMAKKWESEGAQYLHVVDLDAAFKGEFVNKEAVQRIVDSVKIPVQLGGGIRCEADIEERLVKVGVSRVIIGTLAIEKPEIIRWARTKFGRDRVAVGIDAVNGMVATRGWAEQTHVDAIELAESLRKQGADTIIYTDISRDGMLTGPNIEQTERMVKSTWVNVIASGGMSSLEDIKAVRGTGCCGVILGKALYEGRINLRDALKLVK